jgi:hypothetical protein
MTYTATYSPDDNKLRLYSSIRLDRDFYARVRGAGFIYAPKQELFVAPMWTPEREDLLIELCGEIDDEDTSLVERAEERADRFVDYKEKRISDAERAQEAVSRIADNIPRGQPILIGHHSERHAARTPSGSRTGCEKLSRCGTRRSIGKIAPKGHSDTQSTKSFPLCGIAASRDWKPIFADIRTLSPSTRRPSPKCGTAKSTSGLPTGAVADVGRSRVAYQSSSSRAADGSSTYKTA